MSHPLLQIKNLSKQYGKQCALSGVSLEIPQGSIFGLLGPNGAGKTTLIRILNQIIFPDGGEVRLDGEPLNPTHISHIGYMPEERGLYKNMTVSEQLLYLGQLKGLSRQRANEQLEFWLNRLEIGHWKQKKLQELSKGMAQKVQFVATVLHQPKTLSMRRLSRIRCFTYASKGQPFSFPPTVWSQWRAYVTILPC